MASIPARWARESAKAWRGARRDSQSPASPLRLGTKAASIGKDRKKDSDRADLYELQWLLSPRPLHPTTYHRPWLRRDRKVLSTSCSRGRSRPQSLTQDPPTKPWAAPISTTARTRGAASSRITSLRPPSSRSNATRRRRPHHHSPLVASPRAPSISARTTKRNIMRPKKMASIQGYCKLWWGTCRELQWRGSRIRVGKMSNEVG